MNNYLKTVTLGAFTWKSEERVALFFDYIHKTGKRWLVLHFLLVSVCLNFPVMFQIARLAPYELYSRLYGENFRHALPDSFREALASEALFDEAAVIEAAAIEEFNGIMLENGYGSIILQPLLGILFGIVLIIQVVFYLCTAFFLGLSRMHITPLSFRDRMGLAVYSSTLPVLATAIFGMFLPTVHILICYFIVMFFVFQRSKRLP